MHRYRTHTCGVLREGDIGKEVRLSGWCHRIRDHGGLLFIDLRDHYGITQVVADPDSPSFKHAEKLRSEWVVRIDGKVRKRPAGTENPDLPTGAIEIYISEIEVLGPAGELPMPVFGDQEYPEEIRLKYRFLDQGGFSVAVFPRLIAPTASRRFGTGRAQMLLPVWAQKDIGKWSLFGGGGYTINPGAGNRDYWQGGIALTREVSPRLSLGIEATAEGPAAIGERGKATLGVGGSYRLHGPFALLFSAGPGFERGSNATQLHAYAALAMNF